MVGPAECPDARLPRPHRRRPRRPEQFTPRIEGDRLIRPRRLRHERGGPRGDDVRLAPLSSTRTPVRVRFVRGARRGVRGHRAAHERRAGSAGSCVGDFAITGVAHHLHSVWIQARRVCCVRAYGWAAHCSTSWLGDNAVLKAIDVFRRIESLPVFAPSRPKCVARAIDQPRADQRGRRAQQGARRVHHGDSTSFDLPNQDPGDSTFLEQIRTPPDMGHGAHPIRPPAHVSPSNP